MQYLCEDKLAISLSQVGKVKMFVFSRFFLPLKHPWGSKCFCFYFVLKILCAYLFGEILHSVSLTSSNILSLPQKQLEDYLNNLLKMPMYRNYHATVRITYTHLLFFFLWSSFIDLCIKSFQNIRFIIYAAHCLCTHISSQPWLTVGVTILYNTIQ